LLQLRYMVKQQELFRLAIQGLEAERVKIDLLLSELKAQLGEAPIPTARPAIKKRTMSAAGRANIRAAIKRRWQAFHAGKTSAPNVTAVRKTKRTVSKAQLAAMRKNAAKARAAAKAARATA
jgi:hypothetical protein